MEILVEEVWTLIGKSLILSLKRVLEGSKSIGSRRGVKVRRLVCTGRCGSLYYFECSSFVSSKDRWK